MKQLVNPNNTTTIVDRNGNVEICRLCRNADANLISFENLPICYRCATNFPSCLNCGRTIVFSYHRVQDSQNNTLCYECTKDYIRCPVCNTFVHRDDVLFDGLEYVCPDCYSNFEETELHHDDYIHSYGYKPTPRFYGHFQKDLLFGIELEVDHGGEDGYKAKQLLDIMNGEEDEKYVYIKHDGSLYDGFEIVSHPAKLQTHLNEICWEDAFKFLKENGYESDKTSSCGLHIHINRLNLGKTYKRIVEVESRILFFFEYFWDKIVKFSRKSEYQISRWSDKYGTFDYEQALMQNEESRYYSINFQNKNTIEFRVFKGTLDYNTFKATLLFVENLVKYCKKYSIRSIEKRGWSGFIEFITKRNINDNMVLIDYMIKRKIW